MTNNEDRCAEATTQESLSGRFLGLSSCGGAVGSASFYGPGAKQDQTVPEQTVWPGVGIFLHDWASDIGLLIGHRPGGGRLDPFGICT